MSPEHPLSSALQLILWYEALWLVRAAAPLGPTSSLPQSFLLKCLEQMRKVQADSTVLQERLKGCLRQLHSGLVLYQGLLQALTGLPPELTPALETLQLDIGDFAINLWREMEELGVAPAVPPTQGAMPAFTSAFQRRAGGVLVASNLQSFLELAYRALRSFAKP
uniref:Granulocyte colony-stimulating factor n=1 Tax=Neovison vison TaxID=452646 RepID=A0A8C7AIH3_NEOVI